MVAAPAATSGNSALFALLGAGIAAAASLLAVVIKYYFDDKTERNRYRRELDKLRLSLEKERAATRQADLRVLYARLLAGTDAIYRQVVEARRERRDGLSNEGYARRLRDVSGSECQTVVEEVRLVAPGPTIGRTDELWRHLRSDPVVRGVDQGAATWRTWKEAYWSLRTALLEQCRNDLSPAGESKTGAGTIRAGVDHHSAAGDEEQGTVEDDSV